MCSFSAAPGPSDERVLGVSSFSGLPLWAGDEIDSVPVLERLETNVEDRRCHRWLVDMMSWILLLDRGPHNESDVDPAPVFFSLRGVPCQGVAGWDGCAETMLRMQQPRCRG